MTQTWILVADGSNARLFQAPGNNLPWKLDKKLEREHSREKTDRAEVHEDRGEHDFARLLAAQLETKRQGGGFDRLVLVAAPRFLGQLRSELSTSLASCVVRSQDADYTNMSDAELVAHIDIS